MDTRSDLDQAYKILSKEITELEVELGDLFDERRKIQVEIQLGRKRNELSVILDELANLSETQVSPYKGLDYYDVGESNIFFGRDRLINELYEKLIIEDGFSKKPQIRTNFLAIVGASGSGKSSLARAGISSLVKQRKGWIISIMTPTARPLDSLAKSLLVSVEDSAVEKMRQIKDLKKEFTNNSDYDTLEMFAPVLLDQQNASFLLLLIDQFEEIYTLCDDQEEKRAFIANLMNATQTGTNCPIIILLTMRADMYHLVSDEDVLREKIADNQKYIGAMSIGELRSAIEGPAAISNLQFESGLVDRILRDIGAGQGRIPEPGALPLLSHALHESWKRRCDNVMTHIGYQYAGGVKGAIAKTAEMVYENLPPPQKDIARLIFIRLTAVGENAIDTRHRVKKTRLLSLSDNREMIEAVIDKLTKVRLITLDEEDVDVSHEALIREWPRLQQWLNDSRQALLFHRRLITDVEDWNKNKNKADYLYSGDQLKALEEWLNNYSHMLSDTEWHFVYLSRISESFWQKEIDSQKLFESSELFENFSDCLPQRFNYDELTSLCSLLNVDVEHFELGIGRSTLAKRLAEAF